MADDNRLPAAITGRGIGPSQQSGSLVTRGLEAIQNRQRTLVSVSVEADLVKSFHEGCEADERGDFAEAVKWYREAADRGHAGAQFNLGEMYYEGQCVPQDYAEAARWYRLAADQGHAKAQINLGIMYNEGQGVPQDCAEADRWVALAGEQGDDEAWETLAYWTG